MPFYTKRMVRYMDGKEGKKKKHNKHERGLRIAPTGAGGGGKSANAQTGAVQQTEVQTTAPAEVIVDQTFDQKKLLFMKGFLKASVERIYKEKAAYPIKHRYFSRYSILAEDGPIGESAVCKVFKAQHREFKDNFLAVKVYDGEYNIDANDSLFLKILRILGKKQSNIIQTWDIFHNSDNNQLLIFQEFANRGSLVGYLDSNPVDESQVGKWSHQLHKAIDYLGDIGITHRSIQPKHILLSHKDLRLKLTGFENSCIYWDPQKEDIKNIACIPMDNRPTDVPTYQAPEVYGDPTKEEFDPLVADVWSYGATIFYMITKAYPYDYTTNDNKNIGTNIQSNIDQIQGLSVEAKKFLSGMLKPVATERTHIDKLAADPWLKSFR